MSCTVQDYIHRKTHSAQPTLIVTVQAGGPKKNRQARRLSQTGGLSTSHTTTILFRAVQSAPDSIRSWQEALQEILDAPPDQYRSDATLSYSSNRPSTSTARPTLPPSQESYMSASGSHPGSALSIRTSHTAVSSPISSSPQNAVHTFESSSSPRSDHFGSPSPYRTVSPPFPSPPAVVVRETILDRAFKMNCIPGAAPALEGEPAMNSIARFEALMQDVEARRAADARPAGPDGRAHDRDEKDIIPAAAQRALEYIASGQRTSCSTIDSIGGGGGEEEEEEEEEEEVGALGGQHRRRRRLRSDPRGDRGRRRWPCRPAPRCGARSSTATRRIDEGAASARRRRHWRRRR